MCGVAFFMFICQAGAFILGQKKKHFSAQTVQNHLRKSHHMHFYCTF